MANDTYFISLETASPFLTLWRAQGKGRLRATGTVHVACEGWGCHLPLAALLVCLYLGFRVVQSREWAEWQPAPSPRPTEVWGFLLPEETRPYLPQAPNALLSPAQGSTAPRGPSFLCLPVPLDLVVSSWGAFWGDAQGTGHYSE